MSPGLLHVVLSAFSVTSLYCQQSHAPLNFPPLHVLQFHGVIAAFCLNYLIRSVIKRVGSRIRSPVILALEVSVSTEPLESANNNTTVEILFKGPVGVETTGAPANGTKEPKMDQLF